MTRHALPTSAQMMEANRNAFIAKVKEACDEGITEESIEIANALMAIPNLICMILMSGEIAKDVKEFQKI